MCHRETFLQKINDNLTNFRKIRKKKKKLTFSKPAGNDSDSTGSINFR